MSPVYLTYVSNSLVFVFSFESSAGCPDEIILIWMKALSLNMCLRFYRRAGLDYKASNIEFHFLSGSGGNFVAVSAMSIQLKHG